VRLRHILEDGVGFLHFFSRLANLG
jgi:hypothetical protein